MKPPEPLHAWPDYKHLFAWLETATWNLSDESRARIRDEITDHFHLALADGLRAGLSEDAAAERAVASLGSPGEARRAFRRTYLTRWQANMLRNFVDERKPATSSSSLSTMSAAWEAKREWRGGRRARLFLRFYLPAAVAAITALEHQRLSPRELQLRIGIVALMVVGTIVLTAVPRIFRSGRERIAIALGASAELALWSGFMVAPAIGPLARATDTIELRLWLVGALFVAWGVFYTPLLLKLGKRPPQSA